MLMALLKHVDEQLCFAVFYQLVSDIIMNDISKYRHSHEPPMSGSQPSAVWAVSPIPKPHNAVASPGTVIQLCLANKAEGSGRKQQGSG